MLFNSSLCPCRGRAYHHYLSRFASSLITTASTSIKYVVNHGQLKRQGQKPLAFTSVYRHRLYCNITIQKQHRGKRHPSKLLQRSLGTHTTNDFTDDKNVKTDNVVGISNHHHQRRRKKERTGNTILDEIPLSDVRNFCFIAHVDHGKSSLASRVLELAGDFNLNWGSKVDDDDNELNSRNDNGNDDTFNSNGKECIEVLDNLSVEKERGITVKASAASLLYRHPIAKGKHGVLLLNMVDTPGHTDFGNEVTRSLSFVDGAVLLFDATRGVQAQSLSVYNKAKSMDNVKTIIPVLTKVDLSCALSSSSETKDNDEKGNLKNYEESTSLLEVTLDISDIFNFDPDNIIKTSARDRYGIEDVLDRVCRDIPPPCKLPDDAAERVDKNEVSITSERTSLSSSESSNCSSIFRARIVDSKFEPQRGVVCLLQILSGRLDEGDRVAVIVRSDAEKGEVKDEKIQVKEKGEKNTKAKEEINKEEGGEEFEGGERKDIHRDSIISHHHYHQHHYPVQDVGLVLPHRLRTKKLHRGQMGYVIFGGGSNNKKSSPPPPGSIIIQHEDISKFKTTTIEHMAIENENDEDGRGEKKMLLPFIDVTKLSSSNFSSSTEEGGGSVMYASIHPASGEGGFEELVAAVTAMNDTGLEVSKTAGSSGNDNSSTMGGGAHLGPGLKVGFRGLLHAEVFQQRLRDEFLIEAIVTPPKVPYTITYLPRGGKGKGNGQQQGIQPQTEIIEDLLKWPKNGERYIVEEPVVNVRIMSPMEYAGNILELIKKKRGMDITTRPIISNSDENEIISDATNTNCNLNNTWLFEGRIPWGEVVTDFHDTLKSITAGYASLDITPSELPLQRANLSKIDICINSEIIHPLSFVTHIDSSQSEARSVCLKLKNVLPRRQVVTLIQAKDSAKGKIIASERIRAFRKDVLTTGGSKSVGGGDITRKMKVLEKQKKGKKRQQLQQKSSGGSNNVRLSQEAFNSVIQRSS